MGTDYGNFFGVNLGSDGFVFREQGRQRFEDVGLAGAVPSDDHGHPVAFVKVHRHVLEVIVLPIQNRSRRTLGLLGRLELQPVLLAAAFDVHFSGYFKIAQLHVQRLDLIGFGPVGYTALPEGL